jgi:protein-tyrosine kinase
VTHLPSLFVLPVGVLPPNPAELLERPAFELLVRELLVEFDHVVVDTPALEHGAEAANIAHKCGAALVVARQGRSHFHAVSGFVNTLRQHPITLAGVVMNEF